jgi:hypothetical protein
LADAATDTSFDTGTAPISFAGIGGSATGSLPGVKTDSLDDTVAGITQDKRKKLEGRLESLQARQVGLEGAMEADETRRSKQYRQRMDEMVAREGASINDLKPWNAEKELAERKTGLWEQFGSPGFIVSMLASAFTAHPMNSALTSGAAAMNAINQGDMAAYDKAMEAWKANTDIAIKRMNMEHEEFQDIDKLRSSDLQEWQSRMKMSLLKFNDQRGLALMEAGMYPELDEKIAGIAKAREQVQVAQTAIMENEVRRRAIMDSPEGRSGDPQQILRKTYEVDAAMAESKKGGTEFTIQDQYGKHKIRAIPDGQGGWKDPISGKPISGQGSGASSIYAKPQSHGQPSGPTGATGVEGQTGPTEAKPGEKPEVQDGRDKKIQLAINDENTLEAKAQLAQLLAQNGVKDVLQPSSDLPSNVWEKPFGDRKFNESALDGLTPPARAMIRMLVEGKMVPPSGFLLAKSAFWEAIMEKAAEYDPSFDEKTWPVRTQVMKDFLGGVTARNVIRRFNTFSNHIGRLSQTETNLGNMNSYTFGPFTQLANDARVKYLEGSGDPKLGAFAVDANAVANEAEAAFRANGSSVEGIKSWRANMSPYMPLDQSRAANYELVKLVEGQMDSVADRWNKAFATDLPGTAFMSPAAREIFHRITGLQEGREAISAGVPRHEIEQRLRENGIDPAGL